MAVAVDAVQLLAAAPIPMQPVAAAVAAVQLLAAALGRQQVPAAEAVAERTAAARCTALLGAQERLDVEETLPELLQQALGK